MCKAATFLGQSDRSLVPLEERGTDLFLDPLNDPSKGRRTEMTGSRSAPEVKELGQLERNLNTSKVHRPLRNASTGPWLTIA